MFSLLASAATGPDSPSPVPLPPGKPALPGADGTPFGCPSGRKEKPADPVEWTVMDVVEYFTEAGFPEQATAFQEQASSHPSVYPSIPGLQWEGICSDPALTLLARSLSVPPRKLMASLCCSCSAQMC